MKIRLGELRKIIREALGASEDLAAAVMRSSGGGVVVVYRPDVFFGSVLRDTLEPAEAVVGYVRLIDMAKYCSGAWELNEMWGPGYGDMLMDIAFAVSPNGRLVPDRMDVSTAASKMLMRTAKGGNVKLEDLPRTCKTHHDEDHLKKIYSSSGDPARLEALKARHQEAMERLSGEVNMTVQELEDIILDAGASRFSGSIVR